ncbi:MULTISPECIES: alpha/beta hydrolase [unclassified Pseudomonas]|uniref:alpha/beta hydrolase n=1 Tax=unclassified Pseudomonas TaxID=196821 RepID=UPI000A0E892B|nr:MULTISPECIES: alpha/beta hydrolase [unclassified Pseudomonas]SMF26284.1 Pimeloyl-ACP methyl ester carboxylesterase [Pseudomonas sp. LAIL14HWK12:I11]SMR74070.1 Pimeloyl-ACP methyl ester carboxylesterase [Pseudomonas sp. LAIL14HWK12:I10]SOD03872.1 Pimeloyl-ACP methyl ester carboxylesterase [Pseudomonas sp. LAIL14HWK12:I8]
MRSLCGPKDHLLDLDGIEIAVRTWGPEDGIPVLALHGWLDNAASFDRLGPLLDGCFVVAPDLVGHGRSSHRRHDSGYYLWEHAEDMLAVVDSLGLAHFHVLAHGMGSGIASLLAALSSGISSMTFLDGMGAPFTVAEDDRVQHLARSYRLKRMVQRSQLQGFGEPDASRFDTIEAALQQRRHRLDGELSEDAARLLARRDLLQVGDGYCWRHDPRLVLPEPMPLTEREACDLLSQIQCPLYLMFGRQGAFSGNAYAQRETALPGHARVSWHPGGHHFHLEAPDRALVDQLLRLLARHEGGQLQRLVNE